MKKCMMEQLDPRVLLAANYDLVGTALTVNNATNVQFNQGEDGILYVVDKSLRSAPVTYFPGVTDLTVNGTAKADQISGGVDTINATINGGKGNDTILFSNNGANHAVVNDTFGKNQITVSNNGNVLGGTIDVFTNSSSTVTVRSPGVSVFRS